MSKRRISHQQQARIKKLQENHVRRLQQTQEHTLPTDLDQGQEGLLIAHYGVYVDVEAKDGKTYRCNIRQNLGTVVAGDKVVWQAADETTGILLAVLPRQTLLSRPIGPNKNKPIAANVDQVVVVFASEPRPAVSLIDSYLVAIEHFNLDAIIICNKADLLTTQGRHEFNDLLQIYQDIGYPSLFTSAENAENQDEFSELLKGHTSILVGQSGVGKSSLINGLIADPSLRVADFSGHGVHTTTTSRLYHLRNGGDLIDSPGVRDFVLWDMPVNKILSGFREFRPFLLHCRFRDCTHTHETSCALEQASKDGKISPLRLASYRRIYNELQR